MQKSVPGVVFTHSPLKCCVDWQDALLFSSPLVALPEEGARSWLHTQRDRKVGVPSLCPDAPCSCCSVSEPLSPGSSGLDRGGTSRHGSSQAFPTPPVRLSCTPLVCAPCQLNSEGQQASGALGGTTQQRSPGSLSPCVERMSRGGSLAHIVGHKDQVDFTEFKC